jgi:hypothetical protein
MRPKISVQFSSVQLNTGPYPQHHRGFFPLQSFVRTKNTMQFPGGFGLDGMGAMFGGMGMGGEDDGSAPPPRNAGYVKLHASDTGKLVLSSVFPENFATVPTRHAD